MVTEVEPDAPAQRAGLRRGDVILTAGGKKTASAQALLDSIQSAEPIVVRVERGGHEAEFLVTPEKTASGYRLGILVRDHIAGIGTVTYYDPVSLQYGALGHGVSGLDGTQLLMLQSGYLVRASVAEVRTGTRGTPGELHGIFDVTDAVGTVEKKYNLRHFRHALTAEARRGCQDGAGFGGHDRCGGDPVQCGRRTGPALFHPHRPRRPGRKNGRNLLITVTDEALLAKTGGIVQGMSGSPILQNGKLVGAVTHVLVNDPTMGYGVLIENMLDAGK